MHVRSRRNSSANRRTGLVFIISVVCALLAPISLTAPWRLMEMRAFDILSTVAIPDRPPDGPIIIAIDEPSLAELGMQWPWPRDLHARLIESLRNAGAKTIGIDVIFADPSPPSSDSALARVMGADIVLAADETAIDTPQGRQIIRVEPLRKLTDAGARAGIATIPLDGDGTLRRLPAYPDGFARQLLRIEGSDPQPGGGLIQVFGPARTYETVSYYQALDPEEFLPERIFEDRVIIVGLSLQNAPTVDAGGADAHATSFTLRSGRLTPGAEIQATMYDNLRAGLLIKPGGNAVRMACILIAALLAAMAVWRGTGAFTVVTSIVVLSSLIAGSWALLEYGRFHISPIGPAISFVLVAAGQGARDYALERRQRVEITRAFSQYLSPVLVERLASDPSQLKLGGELRTITVLFADVRGFTSIAESMKDDPQRLTTLINRLLDPLSRIVLEEGGTIDKYIGDCLMAFWNAPLDDSDHAFKAVTAGLRMLEAVTALNGELALETPSEDRPPFLGIGIGINTGECIVGNMGSAIRFDYSAIGDAVNLASRLEGKTRDYDAPIIIGPETARHVGDRFEIKEIDRIAVKGRVEIIPIYAVSARDVLTSG